MNGVWLHEWVKAQKEYNRQMRENKSAEVRLIRLTLLLQRFAHSLWKTRNDVVHNEEDSMANKKRHDELNAQIEEIYNLTQEQKKSSRRATELIFLKERNE